MPVQEHNAECMVSGPCAECGMVVVGRMEVVDCETHSRVALCQFCWAVSRQRQVFAGGCCG